MSSYCQVSYTIVLEGKRPARLEQVAEELVRKKKLGKKEGIEFDEA